MLSILVLKVEILSPNFEQPFQKVRPGVDIQTPGLFEPQQMQSFSDENWFWFRLMNKVAGQLMVSF